MDKISKFLKKLTKKERGVLLKILADLHTLNLKSYDIKALQGYKNCYRLRHGSIRIIFTKEKTQGRILQVSYRKDAYKN